MQKNLPGPGTVVGANVHLVGALKDTNDIAVHGTIDGEVGSEKVITVGETAVIKGPVTAQTVLVSGTVRGAVTASQRIEVMPSGKVYGSITTNDLIIRSGATFVGKSTMPDKGKEQAVEKEEHEEKKDEKKEKEEQAYELE